MLRFRAQRCQQVFDSLAICNPQGLRCFQPSQDQFGQCGISPGFAESINSVSLAPDELLAIFDVPDGERQILHEQNSLLRVFCLHLGGTPEFDTGAF
jgi:hypothetical protein